ncbi:MAG: hypothetical protein KJI70_00760 [Patescibacteria group bacterium]|nr:hypothetical protein [Patescibacteria group bacterium]
MFEKVIQFIKKYQNDIVLLIGVFLVSLLSFAAGYIVAKEQFKQEIKIEYEYQKSKNSYSWSRRNRALSGLEIV